MAFEKASRKKVALKVLLSGPGGSGKTYGALLFARGLVGPTGKIAVIDTENGSSESYEDLTEFFVCTLRPDRDGRITVPMYLNAIKEAQANFDAIVIDSITHEWESLLDEKNERDKLPKSNSYTNFADVTKKHTKFVEAVIQCPKHIICTVRSKMAHEQYEDGGKKKVRKIGMAPIQRDGVEYEFGLHLSLDQTYITLEKNRNILRESWDGKQITVETGKDAARWLETAKPESVVVKPAKVEVEAPSDGAEDPIMDPQNPSELPALARESIDKILNTESVGATREDKIAFMALVDSVLPHAKNSDFEALETKVLELGFAPDGVIMKKLTAAKKASV